MFRLEYRDRQVEAIEGLIASTAWQAERVAAYLRSIAYEDTIFAVDELLGWYSELFGTDPELEQSITRLLDMIVNGDFERVAGVVDRAVRTRRVLERAVSNTAAEAA